MEHQDLADPQEPLVARVLLALVEVQAAQELVDLMEHQDLVDHQELLVAPDLQDQVVLQVHPE